MSNQESDSSSESFSDIVLPSIATPTSVGSLINEFLGDLSTVANFNSISCFTQINNEKIAQIYCDGSDKLSVRTCEINNTFSSLPNKGEQPSIREGFCCINIPGFNSENSNNKNESKSSSSTSSKSSSRSKYIFSQSQKQSTSIAVFGGKSESNNISSELYTYSLETNVWKKIPLISAGLSPRVGHRAIAMSKDDHSFIYVFGGTNGFYLEENLLLICLYDDFASCSVVECEGSDKPCGRCDHSMTLVTDLYSSFQLEANNPSSTLPTQSGPITSQSPPAISIPSMSSHTAIGSTLQSNSNSNKINFVPAWALVFGGKVSNERSDIDLNRKFNDKNQDKVLGDLWRLEIRTPFDIPRWTLVSREGPPGRHSHASFCKDGQFFIAGGYDEKGTPLKDVWRYTFGFGWEEIAVFNNQSIITIFGSSVYGFVQVINKSLQEQETEDKKKIKSKLIEKLYTCPLKMDPALVLLSDEFEKLRKKQRIMWNSISEKMEEIDMLEAEIENGKKFIRNPESFLTSTKSDASHDDDEEENDLTFNFSNSLAKVKKLEKQVGDLRIRLFNESKSNVSSNKAKLEHPQPVCPKLVDFTLELHQKVAMKTEKFLQRKRELESEIQLYTNQKKLLEGINSHNAKTSNVQSSASAQYIEKLRELEIFKEKTLKAEKKLDKMRRKQVLDDQYIINLMYEVTKCENKISKTDKEIMKWEANVERSRIDLKMISSILKVWQSGTQSQEQKSKQKPKSKAKSGKSQKDSNTGSEADSEKQIQKILKKNNILRVKIKDELKSFVDTKLTSFQSLNENVNSLLTTIGDSKQLSDCKPAVLEKIGKLSQALDVLLVPYSKV